MLERSGSSKIIKSCMLHRLTLLWSVFLCRLGQYELSARRGWQRILEAHPASDEFCFRHVDSEVLNVSRRERCPGRLNHGPQSSRGSWVVELSMAPQQKRSEATPLQTTRTPEFLAQKQTTQKGFCKISWLMIEKHINNYTQNSVTLTLVISFTGLSPAVNSSPLWLSVFPLT